MKNRLKDAQALIRSKVYILVTDREATMNGNFKGLTGFMKIHSLKMMIQNGENLLKEITKKEAKPDGRKQRGRPKGSPNKQTKTRK